RTTQGRRPRSERQGLLAIAGHRSASRDSTEGGRIASPPRPRPEMWQYRPACTENEIATAPVPREKFAGSEASIVIARARREDLPEVQRLAHAIWHAHYPGIITPAQIDYMLERGYSLDALERFVHAADRGLELLSFNGELSAFAAWYVTENPAEVKLDRL